AASSEESLRSALRAAAGRSGPTLIEVDQALWMNGRGQ
ncbi:hypothetical protein, partial [Pseudomonas asplenii]